MYVPGQLQLELIIKSSNSSDQQQKKKNHLPPPPSTTKTPLGEAVQVKKAFYCKWSTRKVMYMKILQ